MPLHAAIPDHYALLGLSRGCSAEQIRAAYRLLARAHHPDVNPGSPDAAARTQALNAAHHVLSNPERRRDYDRELDARNTLPKRSRKTTLNVAQEVYLRLEDFLRGTSLTVTVNDAGNPDGAESYDLTIPPETAPGTRFRLARLGSAADGFVLVRVKARADFRFKVRGSDLRCDLRLRAQRVAQGGSELIRGLTGDNVRVPIPPRVARGEVVRIPGEGLPKSRGGRGDLLVRILYTPTVQIRRSTRS